jgi:hypothetical protein
MFNYFGKDEIHSNRMNPFKPLAVALGIIYPVLVSSTSYVAFRVKDTSVLPEYLICFLNQNLTVMQDFILGAVQEKHLIGLICAM